MSACITKIQGILPMFDLFQFPFMIRALIAGILVGFMGSYYGVFIVQRKMSFLGSGLAHAAFGGVALGLLLNAEPLYIAVPFTILIAVLIVFLREKTRLGIDTTIGILFSVSVALGIIFLSLKKNYSSDAFTYLFGSILSVFPLDLYVSAALSLITILTFFRYWQRWAYASFDNELAETDRLPVLRDDYVLAILTAVTIVVSVKIVGIVLIASFLVIPAASARLVSGTFLKMTVVSILIGSGSAFLGLWLSYLLDLPSGAVIILLQAAVFSVSAIIVRIFNT